MTLLAILTLLLVTSHALGLLLRPSDFGHHGYIVHYHRDENTGTFQRHIHYFSGDKGTQLSSNSASVQNDAVAVSSAAEYNVPGNRNSKGKNIGEMELQLRTLIKNNSNNSANIASVNKNESQRPHSLQNRDAPSPDGISKATSLPPGLQFLNKQTNKKRLLGENIEPTTELPSLNLNLLLRSLVEPTTMPSVSKEDALDLGSLLGDLHSGSVSAPHDHSHEHSHVGLNHSHKHSHDHTPVQDPSDTETNRNLFRGLFNQQGSDLGHGSHMHSHDHGHDHPEVATLKPPTTKTVYSKSTAHTKPITKRGLVDGDSSNRFHKTFINNILNINIGKTTQPSLGKVTISPLVTKYVTTQRTVNTHFEPLSGTNLVSVRKMNREQQKTFSGLRTSAPSKPVVNILMPTKQEMVHLQGIHIMFSNGHQNLSDKIPTIHLTASLSGNINHMIQSANISKDSTNFAHATDKITGTAIIRDGHLYLVIYPFGQNKSMELHLNKSVSRIPLPRSKLVSRPITQSLNTPRETQNPATKAAEPTVRPTTASPHVHEHKPKKGSGNKNIKHSHSHTGDHHHHDHHGVPELQLAEVNDTMLQTLLAPIDRFMSPWKSVNFSKVIPYVSKNSSRSSKKREEDNEIDFVTFIAQATDPFERIKTIIASLTNTSFLNGTNSSTPDAKFNFELNIKQSSVTANQDSKSANENTGENNSKEVTDTHSKSTATKQPGSVTDSTSSISGFTNDKSRFDNNYLDSTTPSRSSFDRTVTERNEQNQINLSNDMVRQTTYQPIVNYPTTVFDRPDVHKSDISPPITSNYMKTDPTADGQAEGTAHGDTNIELSMHTSENVATAKPTASPIRTTDFSVPKTTFTYLPNFTFSPTSHDEHVRDFITPQSSVVYPVRPSAASHQDFVTFNQNTPLGSNLQTFGLRNPTGSFQHTRNQQGSASQDSRNSEPLISLADIVNDIRRIQMHDMQRFHLDNFNLNAMLMSEAQQKPVVRTPIVIEAPIYPETSTRTRGQFIDRRRNSVISNHQHRNHPQRIVTPFPTASRRHLNERSALQNALDAMLVLSVDDILADQTTLHGAIVLSHRRDTSSNSNS